MRGLFNPVTRCANGQTDLRISPQPYRSVCTNHFQQIETDSTSMVTRLERAGYRIDRIAGFYWIGCGSGSATEVGL